MPKAAEAPAVEPLAPVVDLPTRTDAENEPTPVTGTLKELLELARQKPEPEPTDPPAAPAPELTKEQRLENAHEALREKMFGKKKAPAKQAAKPTEETPAEPAPNADPEPAKPAATEPPAVPAKPATRRVAVKDPATEAAERYTKLERDRLDLERQKFELEKQRQAAPPAPAPVADPALNLMSSEERYEYEVFGQLAKTAPDKYASIQKQFADSITTAARYKAKWEKDNPGESFSPDDSAHDDFYERNTVRYDKGDFRRAEVKLATPDTAPDARMSAELNKLKVQNMVRDLQPSILQAFGQSTQAMIESIDPEINKLILKDGSAKLLEEYPKEGRWIIQSAANVKKMAEEAYMVLETGGMVAPDERNNPFHKTIIDIIIHQEPLITAQPADQQADGAGRPFATWQQWVKMSPEEQSRHWHLGAREIVEIYSQTEGEKLKAEIDDLKKSIEAGIKRRGYVPGSAPNPATNGHAATAPAPAPRPSPALNGRSVIDTSGSPLPDTEPAFSKNIRQILFKRTP